MGGGNNNVIIRIPSLNEFNNIIFKSDLNGSITPGSNLVWNKAVSNLSTWSQNNYAGNAFFVNELSEFDNEKNKDATSYSSIVYAFRPIIEYRE